MHAHVLDYDLQHQVTVAPHRALLRTPLPFIYYSDFIAANQEAHIDNLIPRTDKQVHLEQAGNDLDRIIVFLNYQCQALQ